MGHTTATVQPPAPHQRTRRTDCIDRVPLDRVDYLDTLHRIDTRQIRPIGSDRAAQTASTHIIGSSGALSGFADTQIDPDAPVNQALQKRTGLASMLVVAAALGGVSALIWMCWLIGSLPWTGWPQ